MARGPGPGGGVSREGVRDVVEGVRPGGERERRLPPAEPWLWHRVVGQLGTAVTVIDPAGRIVAVNPAAERLLGRPAAAMYGQDCMTCAIGTREAPGSHESAARCCGHSARGVRRAWTTAGVCGMTDGWYRSPGRPLP
ncbi:PAS domain-containing protein [Streptomyces sp. NPDC050743]|uniref:PAS domain-containing protein n=1 Tax=Streptomyces sp. NPDC050743 TaxID=3365634 RepID=UPI0037959C86